MHLSQIRFTEARTFIVCILWPLTWSLDQPLGLGPVALGLQLSYYPPARQIARRQLQFHPIADDQPDEIPLDPAADMRRNPAGAVDLDVIQSARQLIPDEPGDRALAHVYVRTAAPSNCFARAAS